MKIKEQAGRHYRSTYSPEMGGKLPIRHCAVSLGRLGQMSLATLDMLSEDGRMLIISQFRGRIVLFLIFSSKIDKA